MATTVQIPGVGNVQFPDGMSEQDISKQAEQLHGQWTAKQAANTPPPMPAMPSPNMRPMPESTTEKVGAGVANAGVEVGKGLVSAASGFGGAALDTLNTVTKAGGGPPGYAPMNARLPVSDPAYSQGVIPKEYTETVRPLSGKGEASTAEKLGSVGGAGLENLMEFMTGEGELKGMTMAEKLGLAQKVAKLAETQPWTAKLIKAGLDSLRMGGVQGAQSVAHGASPQQAATDAAKTAGVGLGVGTALDTAGNLIDRARGAGSLDNRLAEVMKDEASRSAEDTVAKGKELKPAGEQVQAEAKKTRDVAGQKVGAAKEKVEQSLKQPVAKATGATAGDTAVSETETDQLPFPKDGNLSKAAKAVLDDTSASNKLAGLKDPDMADVETMAQHLSEGKDAAGKPLSASPKEAESMKRAFQAKIDALESKVKTGGNGTALHHLENLRAAFNDDLFDAYEKYGDPEAAQNLRAANKEYAKIVSEQTSRPLKAPLQTKEPENIIKSIVRNGAGSQTKVESLMRNMSGTGRDVLRDSVLKEIYRKNVLPDGNIDMIAARKQLYGMGDTAKALFGDKLSEVSKYLDAAAKQQTTVEAAANKGSVTGQAVKKGAKALITAKAAASGGPALAGAASVATDAIFEQGGSGAVKIGISPTEKIVLSPSDAFKKRPLITKFLTAKASGNFAAITSAYNALKRGGASTDSVQSQPRGSL